MVDRTGAHDDEMFLVGCLKNKKADLCLSRLNKIKI